jgi:hypothetical protein
MIRVSEVVGRRILSADLQARPLRRCLDSGSAALIG